jgi:Flp pilus assembly protein TadG
MAGLIQKGLAICVARLRTLTKDFRSSKGGNTAVMFAIASLPIISAVGCMIDYSYASMVKTKLLAAADAATLAAVSNNSPVVTTAKAMTGNGTVSGGSTYLTNYFGENTSAFSGVTLGTTTVTKTSTTVNATLAFSYAVPTYFLKIIGYPSITVKGSSTASFTLLTYIDFYLMLDVSGSMSFPSTTSEQQRLMAVNPDNLGEYAGGCQFACHFTSQGACGQSNQGPIPAVGTSRSPGTNPSPGGYCQGYIISRLGTSITSFPTGETNSTGVSGYNPGGNYVNWNNTQVSTCATAGTTSCIQLRADAVGYAVTALLSQATTTESNTGVSNQFRVGLFPFIQNLCTSSAGSSNSCSVGLTSSLTGSTITTFAQQLASLLDTGVNTTLGSGGTHFENALTQMNSLITSVGTGTNSTNTLPYVFIVSDGSQDYQTQSGGGWGSQNWTSNATVPYANSSTNLPPNSEDTTDYCQTLKNRGITVAVLYIPYGSIVDPNASFANNEDGYANTNVTNNTYSTGLSNCASSGFFYTASTPAQIQTALVTMFEQAVSTAHISQ